MGQRDYRVGRIKVSREIEERIFSLMLQEKDTDKKKKQKAQWYRAEVATRLGLKENQNPSLRSYEDTIRDIRERLRVKDPLDSPWSIGASATYNIPAAVIPQLIEQKRITKTIITIRDALWQTRLYPLLNQVAKANYPKKHISELGVIFMVSQQYAWIERAAYILRPKDSEGDLLVDTTVLDNAYRDCFLDPKKNPIDVNKGFILLQNAGLPGFIPENQKDMAQKETKESLAARGLETYNLPSGKIGIRNKEDE